MSNPAPNKPAITGKYIKLIMYIAVVVLINIAGLTLFYRLDLTKNRIYSLSPASKKVVATLAEPLTLKVFFTKDLPAPHNNTERYLRDLLEEYALTANQHFNYRFYDVNPDEGALDEETKRNQEQAEEYGINPVQIQRVEADEVGFQRAYMGLVIIHGDMVERIAAITTTDGLEYQLTTAIQKLNNKISTMLNLESPVKVRLFYSSSLNRVAPLMQLADLNQVPDKVEDIITKINKKNNGKLVFEHVDPEKDPNLYSEVEKHHILTLKWPAMPKQNLEAGRGATGLVIIHEDQAVSLPILQVLNIPIIGTRYEMVDLNNIGEMIDNALEKVVRINDDLGYLADHGTLGIAGASPMMPPQQQSNIMAFRELVGRTYSIRNINLEKERIPDSVNALVIARPTQPFTDHELYQIDQFLMQGNNLILFPDRFQEVMPGGQQQMMMGGRPMYVPIDTGLEKLMAHWGITIGKAYVLDENCYKQPVSPQMGGGQQPIYFAPRILNRNISKAFDFIKGIKEMIVLKASPVNIDEPRLEKLGIRAHRLVSSSEKSWEMKTPIHLNPMMISPPPATDKRSSIQLAYLLEGQFTSYFKGKPIPAKTVKEEDAETDQSSPNGSKQDSLKEANDNAKTLKDTNRKDQNKNSNESKDKNQAEIQQSGAFIEKGRPAKVFIMAASDMISDTVLDAEGRSPNAMFIMNMIDALNDREEIAVMRSKTQRLNPLHASGAGTKTFIKTFNIVGLPIIVVVFGLLIWMRRHTRKKKIQMSFENK